MAAKPFQRAEEWVCYDGAAIWHYNVQYCQFQSQSCELNAYINIFLANFGCLLANTSNQQNTEVL